MPTDDSSCVEFGLLVAAVIDQRLVKAAEARCRIRKQIIDVEGLDDIDHEIRRIPPRGLGEFRRSSGLRRRHHGIEPQRRRGPCRRGFGSRGGRTGAVLRRYRGGGSCNGDAGHEFAATDIRPLSACQILAWHEFLHVMPVTRRRDAINPFAAKGD
jgi:hypothetical protein